MKKSGGGASSSSTVVPPSMLFKWSAETLQTQATASRAPEAKRRKKSIPPSLDTENEIITTAPVIIEDESDNDSNSVPTVSAITTTTTTDNGTATTDSVTSVFHGSYTETVLKATHNALEHEYTQFPVGVPFLDRWVAQYGQSINSCCSGGFDKLSSSSPSEAVISISFTIESSEAFDISAKRLSDMQHPHRIITPGESAYSGRGGGGSSRITQRTTTQLPPSSSASSSTQSSFISSSSSNSSSAGFTTTNHYHPHSTTTMGGCAGTTGGIYTVPVVAAQRSGTTVTISEPIPYTTSAFFRESNLYAGVIQTMFLAFRCMLRFPQPRFFFEHYIIKELIDMRKQIISKYFAIYNNTGGDGGPTTAAAAAAAAAAVDSGMLLAGSLFPNPFSERLAQADPPIFLNVLSIYQYLRCGGNIFSDWYREYEQGTAAAADQRRGGVAMAVRLDFPVKCGGCLGRTLEGTSLSPSYLTATARLGKPIICDHLAATKREQSGDGIFPVRRYIYTLIADPLLWTEESFNNAFQFVFWCLQTKCGLGPIPSDFGCDGGLSPSDRHHSSVAATIESLQIQKRNGTTVATDEEGERETSSGNNINNSESLLLLTPTSYPVVPPSIMLSPEEGGEITAATAAAAATATTTASTRRDYSNTVIKKLLIAGKLLCLPRLSVISEKAFLVSQERASYLVRKSKEGGGGDVFDHVSSFCASFDKYGRPTPVNLVRTVLATGGGSTTGAAAAATAAAGVGKQQQQQYQRRGQQRIVVVAQHGPSHPPAPTTSAQLWCKISPAEWKNALSIYATSGGYVAYENCLLAGFDKADIPNYQSACNIFPCVGSYDTRELLSETAGVHVFRTREVASCAFFSSQETVQAGFPFEWKRFTDAYLCSNSLLSNWPLFWKKQLLHHNLLVSSGPLVLFPGFFSLLDTGALKTASSEVISARRQITADGQDRFIAADTTTHYGRNSSCSNIVSNGPANNSISGSSNVVALADQLSAKLTYSSLLGCNAIDIIHHNAFEETAPTNAYIQCENNIPTFDSSVKAGLHSTISMMMMNYSSSSSSGGGGGDSGPDGVPVPGNPKALPNIRIFLPPGHQPSQYIKARMDVVLRFMGRQHFTNLYNVDMRSAEANISDCLRTVYWKDSKRFYDPSQYLAFGKQSQHRHQNSNDQYYYYYYGSNPSSPTPNNNSSSATTSSTATTAGTAPFPRRLSIFSRHMIQCIDELRYHYHVDSHKAPILHGIVRMLCDSVREERNLHINLALTSQAKKGGPGGPGVGKSHLISLASRIMLPGLFIEVGHHSTAAFNTQSRGRRNDGIVVRDEASGTNFQQKGEKQLGDTRLKQLMTNGSTTSMMLVISPPSSSSSSSATAATGIPVGGTADGMSGRSAAGGGRILAATVNRVVADSSSSRKGGSGMIRTNNSGRMGSNSNKQRERGLQRHTGGRKRKFLQGGGGEDDEISCFDDDMDIVQSSSSSCSNSDRISNSSVFHRWGADDNYHPFISMGPSPMPGATATTNQDNPVQGRKTIVWDHQFIGCLVFITNWSITTMEDGAFADRLFTQVISRPLEMKEGVRMANNEILENVPLEVRGRWFALQMAHTEVRKMITYGIIDPPTVDIVFILKGILKPTLEKHYIDTSTLERFFQRLENLTSIDTITRVIHRHFMSPGGLFYGQQITPSRLSALSPFYVSCFEDVAFAFGTLLPQICATPDRVGIETIRNSLWKKASLAVAHKLAPPTPTATEVFMWAPKVSNTIMVANAAAAGAAAAAASTDMTSSLSATVLTAARHHQQQHRRPVGRPKKNKSSFPPPTTNTSSNSSSSADTTAAAGTPTAAGGTVVPKDSSTITWEDLCMLDSYDFNYIIFPTSGVGAKSQPLEQFCKVLQNQFKVYMKEMGIINIPIPEIEEVITWAQKFVSMPVKNVQQMYPDILSWVQMGIDEEKQRAGCYAAAAATDASDEQNERQQQQQKQKPCCWYNMPIEAAIQEARAQKRGIRPPKLIPCFCNMVMCLEDSVPSHPLKELYLEKLAVALSTLPLGDNIGGASAGSAPSWEERLKRLFFEGIKHGTRTFCDFLQAIITQNNQHTAASASATAAAVTPSCFGTFTSSSSGIGGCGGGTAAAAAPTNCIEIIPRVGVRISTYWLQSSNSLFDDLCQDLIDIHAHNLANGPDTSKAFASALQQLYILKAQDGGGSCGGGSRNQWQQQQHSIRKLPDSWKFNDILLGCPSSTQPGEYECLSLPESLINGARFSRLVMQTNLYQIPTNYFPLTVLSNSANRSDISLADAARIYNVGTVRDYIIQNALYVGPHDRSTSSPSFFSKDRGTSVGGGNSGTSSSSSVGREDISILKTHPLNNVGSAFVGGWQPPSSIPVPACSLDEIVQTTHSIKIAHLTSEIKLGSSGGNGISTILPVLDIETFSSISAFLVLDSIGNRQLIVDILHQEFSDCTLFSYVELNNNNSGGGSGSGSSGGASSSSSGGGGGSTNAAIRIRNKERVARACKVFIDIVAPTIPNTTIMAWKMYLAGGHPSSSSECDNGAKKGRNLSHLFCSRYFHFVLSGELVFENNIPQWCSCYCNGAESKAPPPPPEAASAAPAAATPVPDRLSTTPRNYGNMFIQTEVLYPLSWENQTRRQHHQQQRSLSSTAQISETPRISNALLHRFRVAHLLGAPLSSVAADTAFSHSTEQQQQMQQQQQQRWWNKIEGGDTRIVQILHTDTAEDFL